MSSHKITGPQKKTLAALDEYLCEHTEGCVLTAGKEGAKQPYRAHKGKDTAYLRRFVERDIKKGGPNWGLLLGAEIMVLDFDDTDKWLEYQEKFPEDINMCPSQTTSKGAHCFFLNTHGFKGSSIKIDGSVDLLVQESSGTRRYVECAPSPNKEWVRPLGSTELQPVSEDLYNHLLGFCKPETKNTDDQQPKDRTFLDFDKLQKCVMSMDPNKMEKYQDWLNLLFVVRNQIPPNATKTVRDKYYGLVHTFCQGMSSFDEDELETKWKDHLGGNAQRRYGIPKLKEMAEKFGKNKKATKTVLADLGGELDDAGAARLFLDLFPDVVYRYGSKTYFWYDSDSGLWMEGNNDISLLSRYAMGEESLGEYGCKETKIRSMLNLVKSLVTNNVDIMNKFDTANHGFIQFRDTVFEMDTGMCHPLSPKFFSLKNTRRKFVARNKVKAAAFAKVRSVLDDTFGPVEAEYWLRFIGYAMFGDNRDRRFAICLGNTAGGKGIIETFIHKAFGDYVQTVDPKIYQKSTGDSAGSATPHLIVLQCCRIAISQEGEMNKSNDGNKIKISVGGDPVPVRGLFKEIREIRMQAVHIHLANDVPEIDPADDAVMDRVRYLGFPNQFLKTTDPKFDPEVHKVRDNTLKDQINSPETQLVDAFFWLCMDGYTAYKEAGDLQDTEQVISDTARFFKAEVKWDDVLEDEFEFTHRDTDRVKLSEVKSILKRSKMDMSSRKLQDELPKRFGVVITTKSPKFVMGMKYQAPSNDADF